MKLLDTLKGHPKQDEMTQTNNKSIKEHIQCKIEYKIENYIDSQYLFILGIIIFCLWFVSCEIM